jgi:hypothetical protein
MPAKVPHFRSVTIAADSDRRQRTRVDNLRWLIAKTGKHERLQIFPDKERISSHQRDDWTGPKLPVD